MRMWMFTSNLTGELNLLWAFFISIAFLVYFFFSLLIWHLLRMQTSLRLNHPKPCHPHLPVLYLCLLSCQFLLVFLPTHLCVSLHPYFFPCDHLLRNALQQWTLFQETKSTFVKGINLNGHGWVWKTESEVWLNLTVRKRCRRGSSP